MSKKGLEGNRSQLRDLAARTLEAYRTLNTAAAEASHVGGSSKPNGNSLGRATELLEAVVTEIKGTNEGKDS